LDPQPSFKPSLLLSMTPEEFDERRAAGQDLRLVDVDMEETPDGTLTTVVCVEE
jgi:hypothetical protein